MSHATCRLMFIVLIGLASVAGPVRAGEALDRIDGSLSAAADFLIQRQSRDGAWRSGVHGSFRDGPSLTPHVLSTLYYLQRYNEAAREPFRRGAGYASALIDTEEDPALHFPVYTAAAGSWVAVLADRSPQHRATQAKWLAYLRGRQLGAELGWDREDAAFGGWGYSPIVPRKPGSAAARHPLVSSNLSATVFAIGAFRSAHVPASDPVLRDALVFVMRCQNFSDDPDREDEQFDDGGFFFAPEDSASSKAGVAGTDRFGRTRLHSYGSMTCDGLRAMLACGLPVNHPRVMAARGWIERHFSVLTNPGTFAADREPIRDATYFYYCWSVAHALDRLGADEFDAPAGRVRWAQVLADELIGRQQVDGSWRNDRSDGREDDPLVAAPFAAAALAICREHIGVGR
jgi:squalene-hopene/tetraprenyl-beta-curcumene cyclase